MGLVEHKRDTFFVAIHLRGETEFAEGRMSGGLSGTVSAILRLSAIGLVASSLGACAVGSMGAMMSDGPGVVASLGSSEISPLSDDEQQLRDMFHAQAEEIETPVWAALEAGDAEPRENSNINLGAVMGVLLTGAQPDAAPAADTDEAELYLASLNAIFDQPSDIPVAVTADLFSKNADARRFISTAREVVAGHDRPVSAVNAAFQAGEMDAAAYRTELARLDADRRVLSGVVTAMRDQRRTFTRIRTLILSDQPSADVTALDMELASFAQYEEMVTRLSAQLAGEAQAGS